MPRGLLRRCLTVGNLKERVCGRLEFRGDAVVDLILAEWLHTEEHTVHVTAGMAGEISAGLLK